MSADVGVLSSRCDFFWFPLDCTIATALRFLFVGSKFMVGCAVSDQEARLSFVIVVVVEDANVYCVRQKLIPKAKSWQAVFLQAGKLGEVKVKMKRPCMVAAVTPARTQ